eukprot:g17632.t1
MAPEAHSPPALRRAERQRFAEAFEAFKAPNAKEGLSVGGFVKLCQRCFRFSDTFGANEAEEIFWEVVLPGGEMDLQGLDTALSLIAWRFGRAAGALKRAVSLAGWTWLDPGVGGAIGFLVLMSWLGGCYSAPSFCAVWPTPARRSWDMTMTPASWHLRPVALTGARISSCPRISSPRSPVLPWSSQRIV